MEARGGRRLALAGFRTERPPPRCLRKLARRTGLCGVALGLDGKELPAAVRDRTRVRDASRVGDPVLVGRADLDRSGQLRWDDRVRERRAGGTAKRDGPGRQFLRQWLGALQRAWQRVGLGRRLLE